MRTSPKLSLAPTLGLMIVLWMSVAAYAEDKDVVKQDPKEPTRRSHAIG